MPDWHDDLSWSNKLFRDDAWPRIKPYLTPKGMGSRIIHTETGGNDPLYRSMDIDAGMDVWQIVDGRGARGIASRVQTIGPGATMYPSFTIRYSRDSGAETEYTKRIRAMDGGGYAFPLITCQAYYRNKRDFLGCAVARTRDIYKAIRLSPDSMRKVNGGGETFLVVWWRDIARIKIIRPDEASQRVIG